MTRLLAPGPFFVVLLAVLGGCAPPPATRPVTPTPIYRVPPDTWALIDERIWANSDSAQDKATTFARNRMQRWMHLVRERTDKTFIHWYSDYWTQQWLSVRMTWYSLTESSGKEAAAERLAEYLQEQYYTQVLEPVAQEIDPARLIDQATSLYIGLMATGLRDIPREYGIPSPAFQQRLERITAIDQPPGASLDQLLYAERLSDVPAYSALITRLQSAEQVDIGPGQSGDRLHDLAKRSADKLVNGLAVRGGVSAAALAAGGLPGILISVGVTGWQAMEHEKVRPALESDLRTNLNTALEQVWRDLVEDPNGGVLGGVHSISAQIQRALQHAQGGNERNDRLLPSVF